MLERIYTKCGGDVEHLRDVYRQQKDLAASEYAGNIADKWAHAMTRAYAEKAAVVVKKATTALEIGPLRNDPCGRLVAQKELSDEEIERLRQGDWLVVNRRQILPW